MIWDPDDKSYDSWRVDPAILAEKRRRIEAERNARRTIEYHRGQSASGAGNTNSPFPCLMVGLLFLCAATAGLALPVLTLLGLL